MFKYLKSLCLMAFVFVMASCSSSKTYEVEVGAEKHKYNATVVVDRAFYESVDFGKDEEAKAFIGMLTMGVDEATASDADKLDAHAAKTLEGMKALAKAAKELSEQAGKKLTEKEEKEFNRFMNLEKVDFELAK